MGIKEIEQFWQERSREDAKVARDLFQLKHYDWSLFLWHLALEKALKSRMAKLEKEIPLTHDLLRLAKEASLEVDKIKSDQLNEITTFNLAARYDDYKLSFHKKATENFTKNWASNCESLILWIKKQA